MTHHRIELSDENLHGPFSASHAAAVTIQTGDTMTFPALNGDWLTEGEMGPPARGMGRPDQDGDRSR